MAGLIPLCGLVYVVKPSDPINRWGALILFGVFVVLTIGIGLHTSWENRRHVRRLQEAQEHGSVTEIQIVSSRCFRIEDDDIGSDYFFDLEEEGVVILNDTEIRASKFPNSDFKIVEVCGRDGEELLTKLRFHGERLTPVRVFIREELPDPPEYPESEIVPAKFEELLRDFAYAESRLHQS
ncbi:hypothetical protein EON79_15730 [bacterium]|nr:MAG: hypothetical protein EON79_15730 [bacterium]